MRDIQSKKRTIKRLLKNRQWNELRSKIVELPVPDIADMLRPLEGADRLLFFRTLPRDIAADVFAELSHEEGLQLIEEFTKEETRNLLASIEPDDRTEFFEELPGRMIQRMLNLLSPEDLGEARTLLGYPEESVGRLMTPDYVAVRSNWTAEQTFNHVRKKASESETINVLYVVDDTWKLIGAISLRDLVLAEQGTTIKDIMSENVVSVRAREDREEAARIMKRYDLAVLPIVSSQNVLIGIVTVDDVLDILEKETTEDFHKSGAVESFKINLADAGIKLLYSKRVSWLLLLIFINLFAGGIIALFEETLLAAIVLVSFLPLLIDSAGNAGSQSAMLVVRALATEDIKIKDWFRLVSKELGVAAALGATMGAVVWALGVYRGGAEIGLIVASTMMLVVMVGSIIGASLPFLLYKLKVDPAVASAPLITSLADIAGVTIYFVIAANMLGIT